MYIVYVHAYVQLQYRQTDRQTDHGILAYSGAAHVWGTSQLSPCPGPVTSKDARPSDVQTVVIRIKRGKKRDIYQAHIF